MNKRHEAYSILSDRLVFRLYWFALVILVALMTLAGPIDGPDDFMRWVSVQDLRNGQGWFDPYQHRLGPGEGTLMHWSRFVDAPILVIYELSAMLVSPEAAFAVTGFVWPTLLAGLTLWAFAATGGALGGREGAVAALLFGVLALLNSGKFDQYSFDHHGLQILLFAAALMFFVQRQDRRYAGLWLGMCLALSLSIGTESLAQIALIAVFAALDWALTGSEARRRTIAMCLGILVTLLVAILATASRTSFFYPGCDALTLSVALPLSLAALGLLVAAALTSQSAVWGRFTSLVLVAAVAVFAAYAYAPYCLGNPIDQMPLAIRQFWLSQITESQNVLVVLQRHAGETIALILISIFLILASVMFIRRSDAKIEYTLFLCLIAAGLVLFLYQSRLMTFLTMSLVAVQAQVLAVLYRRYRAEGRSALGILMILFVVFMSPKTGSAIEDRIAPRVTSNLAGAEQTAAPSFECNTRQAILPLQELKPGFIIADFDYAAQILRHTDHSVLAGNYHRNKAGMLAQIDLFRSETVDAGPRLNELGVDYILICKSHPRATYWSSVSDGDGFPAGMIQGKLPENVLEIPTSANAVFQIFRVQDLTGS